MLPRRNSRMDRRACCRRRPKRIPAIVKETRHSANAVIEMERTKQ